MKRLSKFFISENTKNQTITGDNSNSNPQPNVHSSVLNASESTLNQVPSKSVITSIFS
jgi:hypothetical protein